MGLWNWLRGVNHEGVTPNSNPSPGDPPTVGSTDFSPGDPDGFVYQQNLEALAERAFLSVQASPWDGWPAEWDTPNWGHSTLNSFNDLVDTAWACLDRNSSIMAGFPAYKTRGGEVVDPESWMLNPDPVVYGSWYEFAKQVFWDYQGCGETIIVASDRYSSNYPMHMRALPPSQVTVEFVGGRRRYKLGETDITPDVLHIRYRSSVLDARGQGPLSVAGARMTAAAVLARYAAGLSVNGAPTTETIETDDDLTPEEALDLKNQWIDTGNAYPGAPRVLDRGTTLKRHFGMSPKDMAMIEVAQFTEASICTLLGVPPFMMALPSGNSEVYSNVQQVHDFHDRQVLRPMTVAVMSALSNWALPHGSRIELNRDEYSRPALKERAEAYKMLAEAGAIRPDEIRTMERLTGPAPAAALTGGETTDDDEA